MHIQTKQTKNHNDKESGQSIVLIALLIVGLLAFVGLAVDVGLIFARSAELNKAVDAAALAAVTEVIEVTDLRAAETKAAQFLNSNLPVSSSLTSATDPAVVTFDQAARVNDLGEVRYAVTATWPIELYFLKVIGLEDYMLRSNATAAYFPITDIYASRRVDGALTTSNQAVFGPNSCSYMGDPYSPLNPGWGTPEERAEFLGLYTYRYRILVPGDYMDRHSELRVELFDPDSINKLNNNGNRYVDTVAHTEAWIANGGEPVETLACRSANINPCLIDTSETSIGLPLDSVNPWWFVRIDENRRGNGSGTGCGGPGAYTPSFNTQTRYELSYFAQNSDGTIVQIPISRYTGQVGDGVRDNGEHQTDLQWVSPGAPQIYDQPAPVPAEFGSFQFNLNDLTSILQDAETGHMYIYLDVTAVSGASENGFEVWAGPPDYLNTISSNVNTRNVQIVNNPSSHSSDGVAVFGMGNLPMNSNFTNPVNIPLIYVPPEYAGRNIFVTLFDSDSGASPPITFSYDSIATSDWSMTFGNNPNTHPDRTPEYDTTGRCIIGSCQDSWVSPAYRLPVPTYDEAQCAATGSQDVCTPFFGGRLVANYRGGQDDTYGWSIRLAAPPYLVE
ncbi:MAG: hypothetical protein CSB13_01620 [Chloroflexi bacterium]|nr:MAG: hypothetical protein CSB13_01620 [Chloroflexota bacterium]